MDYNDRYKISQLIYRDLLGKLSDDEKEKLNEWKNEKEGNLHLYNRINSKKDLKKDFDLYNKTDFKSAQLEMEKRISLYRSYRTKRIVNISLKIAAVLIIAIGLLWNFYPTGDINTPIVANNTIVPGESKAMLTLGDGTLIVLDGIINDTLAKNDGALITASEAQINYTPEVKNEKSEDLVYNTLNIPRGGEYRLTLADGTKVWLNSETKLKFPVKFCGKERKVFLEGEAYFQVSHNKKKPFRVVAQDQTIEVLGTGFNVSSYKDEGEIFTTLVEGKVKVTTDASKSLHLSPGEQSVFNMESRIIQKRRVDVKRYIAWKDGKFVFEEQTLEQIMEKLSRWYDVNVFYQSQEARNIVFKGIVPRYGDFSNILKILEKTGEVNFRIKGNTVIITNK
jgi:ferric-dicitrate binding protein FerR (iron transport regulator)